MVSDYMKVFVSFSCERDPIMILESFYAKMKVSAFEVEEEIDG